MRLPAFLLLATFALYAQAPATTIDPPAGTRVLLEAHGDGDQIYTCDGAKWTLKAPDARLLDASGKVIGSHFAGPTWQLADGGRVQGELIASQPSPEPASIPWLLLRAKAGTASGSLAQVAFIRRSDTHGGAAPTSGCATPADTGKTQPIPYTATYTFYARP